MTYIEPRKDIIKLSILVMKSAISNKVKEQFLMSMINPRFFIEQEDSMNLKEIENIFKKEL